MIRRELDAVFVPRRMTGVGPIPARVEYGSGGSGTRKWVELASETEWALEVGVDPEWPAFVGTAFSGGRRWWLYRHEYYSTAEDLTEDEVLALIEEKANKKELRIARAKSIAAMADRLQRGETRRSIPRAVQLAVWERDRGQCAECASNESLEFDHVIPVALGGSTTERNLQLLCAECNRRKGATLGGEQHHQAAAAPLATDDLEEDEESVTEVVERLGRSLEVFLKDVRTIAYPPGREERCPEMIDEFEHQARALIAGMKRAVRDSEFPTVEPSLSRLQAAFRTLQEHCSESEPDLPGAS